MASPTAPNTSARSASVALDTQARRFQLETQFSVCAISTRPLDWHCLQAMHEPPSCSASPGPKSMRSGSPAQNGQGCSTASGIGLSIAHLDLRERDQVRGFDRLASCADDQAGMTILVVAHLHQFTHHAPRLGLLRQRGCDGADADFMVAVLDPFAVSRGNRRAEHADPFVLSRQQLPRPLLHLPGLHTLGAVWTRGLLRTG